MERTSVATVIWNFLSSKTLNIFLLISGAVYGILLSIWAAASPNEAVVRIANSLPMKLWLTLFVTNNLFCVVRYFSIAVKACALDTSKPTIRSLVKKRNHLVANSPWPAEKIALKLAAHFRARGYKVILSRDNLALRAVRRRWAALGTLGFHLSFFLIVAGMVVSPWLKTQAELVIAKGDTFSSGRPGRLMQVEPAGTAGRLPDFGFQVQDIRPRFWKNELFFTDLRARVRPIGSQRDAQVMLSSAWKPGPATYVTLIGIGYAPFYKVLQDGQETENGYVNLASFPPGTEDNFDLSSAPWKVYVKVLPDYRLIKGKLTNKSMNLRRPGYIVRVAMGKAIVFRGFVRPNQAIKVGRTNLSFPKVVYWGQFRIVHNPALLLIWLGFAIGLSSLVWRLIFYRKDFAAAVEPADPVSIVHLHARSDYYPRQIAEDLKALAEEIESWPAGPAFDEGGKVGNA